MRVISAIVLFFLTSCASESDMREQWVKGCYIGTKVFIEQVSQGQANVLPFQIVHSCVQIEREWHAKSSSSN